MQNTRRDRRINGAALEMIMQDVLRGMADFTLDACCGCDAENLEILGVETPDGETVRSPSAVLRFPERRDGTRQD